MFRTASPRQHCLPLLTLVVSAAASPGFWEKIYSYEAPPPELGPPGAAAALRDPKQLPWEICGIVGAYLVTVGFALTLLLTVGRRMRRNAEMSPVTLETEMVKAGPQAFEPTPISPASTTRSWIQKTFKKTPSIRSGMSSPTSPTHHSVASFDHVVLQTDKEDRQKEMERLYAAVMEHQAEQEARKSQAQSVVSEVESPVKGPQEPRRPLHINTTTPHPDLLPSPQSATSYQSYRGFHPAEQAQMPLQSPYGGMASPRKEPPPMSPGKMPLSPRSILSRHSRPPSQGSTSSSKTRKALRNLRISAPIQRFPNDNDEEARTPLSPRFYDPPAPPALPSQATTPARTPGTANTVDSAYAHEARDRFEPLPIPRANPQRAYSNSGHSPASGPLSPPPALTFSPAKSATSSTSSLPLRSYQDATSSHGNLSAMPPPPTPTKTTYLERRREQLSLTTPRTGLPPSTPYSPYMPFTPITPITPHLVTKRERKERKKMEGKKVLTEEDMVRSDDDTWY